MRCSRRRRRSRPWRRPRERADDRAAPRPRRRLRRPVRAADRPARARGRRLQRDRAAHRSPPPRSPRRTRSASCCAAARRACTRRARPTLDPGILELGVPTLGICYGFQVMAQQLGGEVANTGLREYGSTDATAPATAACCSPASPTEQTAWMSHGDSVVQGARGLRGARLDGVDPGRRVRAATRAGCTACSGTPRSSTPSTGSACSRTSCTRRRASPPTGTAATSSPSRSSASARRSAPAA